MTKKGKRTALLQRNEQIAELQGENEELKARLAEHEKAERAPERSQELLRAFMDSSTDAHTVYDSHLNLIYLNEAALRYLGPGVRREDVIGKNLADFITDRKHLDPLIKVMETGESFTAEDTLVLPAAGEFTIITRAFRVGDGLGIVTTDITARKRMENELRQSEQRHRLLAENSVDVIWTTDLNFRPTYISPAMTRLTGYSVEEAMSRTAEEAMTPESLKRAAELLARATTRKAALSGSASGLPIVELELKHKNGSTVWVATTASFIRDSSGEPFQIMGSFRDVTERKRAEETLRASEERYRLLVERTTEAIMVIQDWTVRFANPKVLEVSGYTTEELVFKPFLENIHPDDRQMVAQIHAGRLRGEKTPRLYQCRLLDKAGSTVWVEISGVLFDWEGKPATMVLMSVITERKKVEEALRASKESYRLLVENAREAITVAQDGVLRFFNPRFAELSGYTVEELASKPFLDFIHPDDRQMVADYHVRRLKGEEVPTTYQFKFVDKAGSTKWAGINAVLFDWEGRPAVLAFLNDITARKQAEEALRASEERNRLLVEKATEGIMVIQDWTVRFVNPKVVEVSDYATEEMVFKPFLDFIHPDDRQMVEEHHARRLRGEEVPRLYQCRLLGKAGNTIWVEVSGVLLDWEGRPAVLALLNDITERKKAEEAVRASEERYRLLVEKATEAIVVIQDGILRFANPKILEISGYAAEELVFKPFLGYIHPDDQQMVAEYYARRLRGEKTPRLYQCRLLDKAGSTVWVEISGVLFDWEGRPATMVLMSVITERKRAEEAVRESGERYRALYEDNPSMYFTVDPAGTVLSVNQFGCEELGYTAQELLGQSVLKVFHDEDKAAAARSVALCVENQGQVFHWELRKVQKSGSVMWVKETARAVRGTDGKITVFIVCEDITERKRAEEELRMSEERFRALHEASFGGIGIHDKGVILDCNQGLADMTGYTLDELIGMDGLGLIAPAWRDHVMEKILSGYEKPYEVEGLRKDGSIYPLQIQGKNIPYHGRRVRVTEFRDIAERKQAEETLKVSEERYRLLFHRSPVGVFHYDTQLCITDCNSRFEAVLQSSRERLVGLDLKTLKDQSVLPALRQALEGKEGSYEGFYRATTSSSELWISMHTAPLFDQQGKVSGAVAIVEDVTERKRAEKRVEESERQYRLLAENASDVIWVTDMNLRPLYLSPSITQFLGYSIDEAMSRTIGESLTPLSLDAAMQALASAVSEGSEELGPDLPPRRLELLFKRKDGSQVWADTSVSVIRGPDGRPIQIMGVLRDVTERKRAEEELRRAHAELEARVEQRTAELQKANALLLQEIRQRQQAQDKRQETESKYRELVENANSIILELDTSGKVSFLNRFAQEFFGFSEAEIVGRHAVGTIVPLTDSEGNDLRVKIKDLTKHPEDHYTSESEGIRQDGKRVWIGWTNQGLYDKKGRLLRILCIGMDRTKQRQVAAMLAEQEKEKAAAAERQRLARDLHDAVTQTLFSASLIAEVLPQLWEKDRAEGRHRLEELRRLTRGALAEMRMLLLELRPAALGEVGLVDLLRQLSEATTGRTTLPVAFTSRGQCTAPIDVQVALYRVAQEALNNVVKHSGATKASISLHCRENSADLTISDNGSGFDLQAVSPKSLGLRIMRERAEAAGAKLKIESQAGLGTKVGVLWSDATRKGGS